MTTQEEKEQILFVDFEVNQVIGLGELKLIPSRIVTNLGDYDVNVIGNNDYLVYHNSGGGYFPVFDTREYYQDGVLQQGLFWRANPNVKVNKIGNVRELDSNLVPSKWLDFDEFGVCWYEVGDEIISINETDDNIIWCSRCKVIYDSEDCSDYICEHVWWCRGEGQWNTPDEACGHDTYDDCNSTYDNSDND